MNKKSLQAKAFSLIELSIAVLIIGIIIAGITQSSSLIQKMALNSARSLTSGSPVVGMRDLVAWYETTSEASFSSSVDPDSSTNNAVSTWNDINPTVTSRCNLSTTQSSNGTTATNAPVLRRRAIGNLQAVFFDGATTYLSCDNLASTFSGGDKPMSIFVVANFNSFSAQSVLIGFSNSTNGVPIMWFRSQSGSPNVANFVYRSFSTLFSSTNSSLSLSSPTLLSYVLNGNVVSSYFNGSFKQNDINGQYASTLSLNQFSVGSVTRSAPSNFYSGALGEIIIFNRALNSEELTSIHGYLKQKWGIR